VDLTVTRNILGVRFWLASGANSGRYLGYLGTMGADFMDYIIADSFLFRPEYKKYYSEKVAYLPSYQANDRQCAVAETRHERSVGCRKKALCSVLQSDVQNFTDVFDVWMRLLKAVKKSIFWCMLPTPMR